MVFVVRLASFFNVNRSCEQIDRRELPRPASTAAGAVPGFRCGHGTWLPAHARPRATAPKRPQHMAGAPRSTRPRALPLPAVQGRMHARAERNRGRAPTSARAGSRPGRFAGRGSHPPPPCGPKRTRPAAARHPGPAVGHEPAAAALPRPALDLDINKPTGHPALVYSHNRMKFYARVVVELKRDGGIIRTWDLCVIFYCPDPLLHWKNPSESNSCDTVLRCT